MPLAFITNNNFLKKNNLKAPTSWQDFLKPEYKEGLILADAEPPALRRNASFL